MVFLICVHILLILVYILVKLFSDKAFFLNTYKDAFLTPPESIWPSSDYVNKFSVDLHQKGVLVWLLKSCLGGCREMKSLAAGRRLQVAA